MAIWVPLDKIPSDVRDQIAKDLTVVQLDESYEKMKRRGKIMPGYTPDPNSKIPCFHIDTKEPRNLWLPYYYARTKFNIVPNLERFPVISDLSLEVTLRPEQEPVVETCFDDLVSKGTTTVGLPPAFGKTYIGAFLSHCLRLKVLVIVPITAGITQWETTFKNAIPGIVVWCVPQNGKLPEGFTESSEPPDVIVALDPRISKIPERWRHQMGTVIIDEAHLVPTRERIVNLLSIRPAYVIMETATMEREDGLHKICQLIAGEHGVYRKSSNPYLFKIVDLPFINVVETYSSRGVNYGAVCDQLSSDAVYNRVILGIVQKNPDNKFMILTRRADHGNSLKAIFESHGITSDTYLRSKKSYVDSRVLIGTFQKMGTGFDEATVSEEFTGNKSDSLIICHSVAKNRNFEQFRGRVMRSHNPTVYWLNVGNKVIRAHLTPLKKYVRSTNGSIMNEEGIKYLEQ